MKYALLNYITCPHCPTDSEYLVYPVEEIKNNDDIEIRNGLLICNTCHRWFPIRDLIPELLPDYLRDWDKDLDFLKIWDSKLPASRIKELWGELPTFVKQGPMEDQDQDHGSNYKKAEINIKTKITEEHFFGPGFTSPFNSANPEYTMHLIRRLGNVLPLLELKKNDVVLDMGAGYAWTTEWMMKMGMIPIGVDICRTYLDIGIQRMSKTLPHLVIGDIEHLPIKSNCLNAVLCYDAFHHIPDRKKAMTHFTRALGNYGNIVLAEPGGSHEFAKVSKNVMAKYGILEKGMELDDIKMYCKGLNVLPPAQQFVLKIQESELDQPLSREFAHDHAYVDCNIYVIKKQAGAQMHIPKTSMLKIKIKAKIKRLLKKIIYKLIG